MVALFAGYFCSVGRRIYLDNVVARPTLSCSIDAPSIPLSKDNDETSVCAIRIVLVPCLTLGAGPFQLAVFAVASGELIGTFKPPLLFGVWLLLGH